MRNQDLIAYLKPFRSRFSHAGEIDLVDMTGRVTDATANRSQLRFRLDLSGGLYRIYMRTQARAFGMATASLTMVRVPDGKRVSVGPWDLDHLHNVMAIPMARISVNGVLKGGLWFAMPGPDEIAEGRLFADFGFEAVEGQNDVVVELVERDRERFCFDTLEFVEIREDDRRRVELLPANAAKPRLFVSAADAQKIHARWLGHEEFEALGESLRQNDLVMLTDNSQGTLSLAIIYYALTGDVEIGERARSVVLELAHAATWSGRPDPLLMGGENDRGISLRLFHVALAWEHLQPLLDAEARIAMLAKAEEYICKMYDFTVLQRAYMGCPAIDPHAVGSWNGPAIACMAFYDELAIARHALPFFHGLFVDSLQLFPESGKAAWATYFPFHMVWYLAAAHTFAGFSAQLSKSSFLDHLGEALLTSFESPNSQELQRGLRTREHRFLTAFLYRFHATPGIDTIYRAFAERERKAAGDLSLGIFDLLYAPELEGDLAPVSDEPLFAREIGDVIVKSRERPVVALSMSAGAKAGCRASFTLMPQNREFAPSMGALEVTVDGAPVLCNINISSYGINSALTNTMCIEDGGGITNGQYLNGAVQPEHNSVVRRYFCSERFIYAHILLTGSLHPSLEVETAERLFVFDRDTGSIVLADAFEARRELRFATHLHCSGSASALHDSVYRMTGGQAELIAGIKHGGKGLDNEERGELFVRTLRSSCESQVVLEEPAWIPGYIYGLNLTGLEAIEDGRYPRYTRWKLHTVEPVRRGEFLFAISTRADGVKLAGDRVEIPCGGIIVEPGRHTALGVICESELLLWDETQQRVTAIGVTSLTQNDARVSFGAAVDIEYDLGTRAGKAYSASSCSVSLIGFAASGWQDAGKDRNRTHGRLQLTFAAVDQNSLNGGF
jgi:hypothetical protein